MPASLSLLALFSAKFKRYPAQHLSRKAPLKHAGHNRAVSKAAREEGRGAKGGQEEAKRRSSQAKGASQPFVHSDCKRPSVRPSVRVVQDGPAGLMSK